ncbi:MAG: hypothetical protein FD123_886 [Bacteroidetes bacterium]|nr:MAG: hypothetical protein FD123_886 [Bacteroidota bacterium]
MNLQHILDFLISMVFIFALLSSMTLAIQEMIMYFISKRGKMLYEALCKVLDEKSGDENYAGLLYNHPQIDLLKKNKKSLPSYLAAETFASTLIDVLAREYDKTLLRAGQTPGDLTGFEKCRLFVNQKMKNSELQVLFQSILNESDDHPALKKNFQDWFNRYMDRVSGWYKNNVQKRLFILGLIMAVFLNVDALRVAKQVWSDAKLNDQLDEAAEVYYAENKNQMTGSENVSLLAQNFSAAYSKLGAFQLPIFWKMNALPDMSGGAGSDFASIALLIAGWIITASIIAFGSPFLFQVLGKLIDIRKAGIKPDEKKK